MTSNLGSQYAFEMDLKSRNDHYMDVVKQHFKPEFINRIDEIVVFNALTPIAMAEVARKFVDALVERVNRRGYELIVEEAVVQKIVKEGSDVHYGARPMKRYIQNNIETPIAYKIMEDNTDDLEKIMVVGVKDDAFTFNLKSKKEASLSLN